MQNKRQEQLLALLAERRDYMTSRQLAEILQVSDRTIRSDVEAINRRSSPPPIESNVRQGYRLNPEAAVLPPASELDAGIQKDQLPQTPGDRCIYIIHKLLFEVRELNLTVLQGQIYVSGYSIENDLKRIRRMLEPYANLKLVRSRECISLKGDEASKRRFYRDLLVAEVQENFLNLNTLAHLYRSFDLIEVKDIFVEVLEEYDYAIHEALFPMLILHAGTSIERMNCSNYINMEDNSQGLSDTIEYQISKTFFDRIGKRLHIQVHDGEIGMFALVIMGRRASNYTSDYVNLNGRWLNTKKLVAEALDKVLCLFGLDFREDADLIAGLKMHIHGLIDRLKTGVRLEDVFLDEIKRKYPLVFEMGIYVGEFLKEKLGLSISDVESGFIALHLGAASERLNAARRYRAVMILPHNQSFSAMCEKKISDMFRDRIQHSPGRKPAGPEAFQAGIRLPHRQSGAEGTLLPGSGLKYPGPGHRPALRRLGAGWNRGAGVQGNCAKARGDVPHLLCQRLCHSPRLRRLCKKFHHRGGPAEKSHKMGRLRGAAGDALRHQRGRPSHDQDLFRLGEQCSEPAPGAGKNLLLLLLRGVHRPDYRIIFPSC